MEIYEISIDKNVTELLKNPYIFAGITGHILLTNVFDRATNTFKPYSESSQPDLTKFQAVYIFDHEGNDFTRGVLKYIFETNQLSYYFETIDGSINGNLDIIPTQRTIKFVNNVNIRGGGLFSSKKNRKDLIKHILIDHVKPFLILHGVRIINEYL